MASTTMLKTQKRVNHHQAEFRLMMIMLYQWEIVTSGIKLAGGFICFLAAAIRA